MDSKLVYAKTPIGEEAIRQNTGVVHRNLRLVLIQVDGKLTVDELAGKIGSQRLVEAAIEELVAGGFIVPSAQAAAAWEMGRQVAQRGPASAVSGFSAFVPSQISSDSRTGNSRASQFSSFGKPILATPHDRHVPAALPEGDADVPGAARRRWPAGKILLVLLLMCLVALLAYPYSRHKADVEAAAGSLLQTRVRIDSVTLALLPHPHLLLQGVRLGGELDEGQIAGVRIYSLRALLTGMPGVEEITLEGASLSLVQWQSWAHGHFSAFQGLRRVTLTDAEFRLSNGLLVGGMQGQLNFTEGRLLSANLEDSGRNLLIKATPAAAGLQLSVEGRAWRPAGWPLAFDMLQLRGLLLDDQLAIEEIDSTFLGGLLKGSGSLRWHDGVQLSAVLGLTRLDMRRVSAAFAPALQMEGDLSGQLRLEAKAADWQSLWPRAQGNLAVDLTRGVLHGTDIGEAARRGAGASVSAGTTRFDRLRADADITAERVVMRHIDLDAGLMTASGQLEAGRGATVDASLLANIRTSVSALRVPLQVTGQLPNLTVTSR